MIKILLLVICLCVIATPCHAWPARVVAVIDGDTIDVEPVWGGKQIRVRLYGIDSPERKQPFGETARGVVFNAILYRDVSIEEKNRDRYGRIVATVRLDNAESLQSLLLKSGLAWVWPRYCRDCQGWEELQKKAQESRLGVWSDHAPIPPWEWRRGVRQ